MNKIIAGLAIAALLGSTAALADSLPEDVPVTYPELSMDTAAVDAATDADAAPQLDDSAIDESSNPSPVAKPDQANSAIRPGSKPESQTNSLTIETVSDIQFPSPYLPGTVNVRNPEGSTVNVQYMLRISVAELQRQTGLTGYTAEEYAELQATEGYEPETDYIVLSQTQGIAPGKMVQTMTLGALPDGSTIPAGDYQAEMIMAAYDVATNKRSMVNAVVKVQFHVLSDQMTVVFDANGVGQLYAFNPVTQGDNVMFAIQISQQALLDGCGEVHRTAEELALQQADSTFDPAYEFIIIYESNEVAPGGFVDADAQLTPLPDGAMLPAGTYAAWLVRYNYDAQWDSWQLDDAMTQLSITVTEGAASAAAE